MQRITAFLQDRFSSKKPRKIHYPLGYFAALDGLRGVMTLGVIVAHINHTWLPGSVIFMDAFFVMSAYLITSILLKSYRNTGSLQFKVFYIRRFKRIFPAYYFMLLCFTLAAWLLSSDTSARWLEALAAGTYVANWMRAFDWLPMPYLGHTWSLSIEEQYYLFWPLMFLGLLSLLKLKPRLIFAVSFIIVLAVLWRYQLATEKAAVARLFNGLDTRADALLLGCLLALVELLLKPFESRRITQGLQWASFPIFLGLAWVSSQNLYFSHEYYAWGAITCCCLSTLLIASLVSPNNRTWLRRLLEWPLFIGVGRICYGLYLWHFPIIQFLKLEFGLGDVGVTLIAVPLSFLMAGISYRWIEKPFLTSKKRYQERAESKQSDANASLDPDLSSVDSDRVGPSRINSKSAS